MTVLQFPGHLWAHCESKECTGCFLCTGGLAFCRRCGGAEGSLPTDCPGVRMRQQQEDEVYAGTMDYRRAEGWVKQSSKYSPHCYTETEEKN